MFALLFFMATGCSDDQEIFFEDYAREEAPEVVHPDQRDKPYPREEHELYINPAPLLVPRAARKENEFLEFELSHDTSFPEQGTYRSGKLNWNVFNIHEEMAAGQWYWRFRTVDQDGRTAGWSKVYSFTVTGKEPVFVTPDFSVLRQNIPVGYPRIHCHLAADIETAKAKIQEHVEYDDMISRAEQAYKEQGIDAAKGLYLQSATLSEYIFDYLYTAYLLTGETKYYDKMLDYVRRMLGETLADDTWRNNDFAAAEIVTILSTVYDACQNDLTADEMTKMETEIMKIATYYYNHFRGRMENWFFDEHTWQVTLRGMVQGTFVLCQKNPEAMTILQYFYELWTSRAPSNGFNRDGSWFNGAGYFQTNQYTLYYMTMLLSHLTGADFLQHPWFQNAGRALVYSWLPDSQNTSFGDFNREDRPARSRIGFADFLARELNDPNAIWYVQECQRSSIASESMHNLYRNYDLRLYRISQGDAPYNVGGHEDPGLENFVWYKDSGEGVAFSDMNERSSNMSLAFRSSPYGSGNHTHSDQNSFRLLYKGEYVYMNAGYYQVYNDAHAILQYRNTRGHNTVMVNGVGQPFTTRAYGNIERALNGDNLAYFMGDASQAYCGTTENTYWINSFAEAGLSQTQQYGFGDNPLNNYKRQIFMLRPNKVVIYDDLGATEPATWQWLLHSPVEFHVAGNKVTTENETVGFTSVAQIFSDETPKITTTNKWFPGGEPAKAADKQWHLTAEFGPVAQNKILTIIQVSENGNVENIWRVDDTFTVGDWTIEAELSADKPAAISIANTVTGTVFDNSDRSPVLGGAPYQRMQEKSSVLYDKVRGTAQTQEIGDKPLQVTRALR